MLAMIALRVCANPPQEGCCKPTLLGLLTVATCPEYAGWLVVVGAYSGNADGLKNCSFLGRANRALRQDSPLCNAYSPCFPMVGRERLCSC